MTPAIDALAIGVAGRLTAGAGRRREPPERATGGKTHAASRFPKDCRGGGLLKTEDAGLMRRAIRPLLLEHAPERSPSGGARWLLRVMLAVYRALCRMAEVFAELHPAIETIAERAGYSVRHTHRALKALAGLKLIEWDRRCVPTDQPSPRGGFIVQQISSVYRLLTPPRLAAIVADLRRQRGRGAPGEPPRADDGQEHARDQARRTRDGWAADEVKAVRRDQDATRVLRHAVRPGFFEEMAARIAADRTRMT